MNRFCIWLPTLLVLSFTPGNWAEEKKADQARERPPIRPHAELTPSEVAVARAINEFALEVYGQLRSRDGNLFFSPYSIATALAMAQTGARGSTAAQMATVLHLPSKGSSPGFAGLIREINGDGQPRRYQLHTANALWGQQDLEFHPAFSRRLRLYFDSELHVSPFRTNPENARRTINAWVEKQTHNQIKDLLPLGAVDTNTRLILTNAVYLKGDWVIPFKQGNTVDGPFQVAPDQKVRVPLMGQTNFFRYLEGEGFQALELPYEGEDLSLVVLLPRRVDGLAAFEKALSAKELSKRLGDLRRNKVEVAVTLPKFKVTAAFSLRETLSTMGMPQAFDRSADFSGISGDKELCIGDVVHKAFVNVDEKGSEAAAATAIRILIEKNVDEPPPKPKIFLADHPFVFLIRDLRSDTLLFLGRITNPVSQR